MSRWTGRPSGPAGSFHISRGGLHRRGFPHGIPTTQAETVNADLLAFLKA
jgi:non-heme chloroperoxidase